MSLYVNDAVYAAADLEPCPWREYFGRAYVEGRDTRWLCFDGITFEVLFAPIAEPL